MGIVIETEHWRSRLDIAPGGLRQRGPADPFVAAMKLSGTKADRLFLATRALRRDPDCIEANLVVAAACQDEEMRLAYLNIAVEAGEELWGAVEERCNLGAVHGAQPWLQAIKALGKALAKARDIESAADCFGRLLELDPADGHGAGAARDGLAARRAPVMR